MARSDKADHFKPPKWLKSKRSVSDVSLLRFMLQVGVSTSARKRLRRYDERPPGWGASLSTSWVAKHMLRT